MADDKGKGPGKGKGKAAGKGKASDETGEYELGDDFLGDLNEEEEIEAEEDLEEEDLDEERYEDEEYDEDLEDEIVSAETVEWTPEDVEEDEPPKQKPKEKAAKKKAATKKEPKEPKKQPKEPAEAEETLVVAAEGTEQGRLASLGSTLASPFRRLGRVHLPMWARFLAAATMIVVSMAAATSAYGLIFLNDFAEGLDGLKDVQDDLEAVEGGAPQTILIIGSDLQPVGASKKHTGLSDTTMLLRLDPDRNAIALFSLPRDLKVDIPGYGTAKLNEAYTAGGPELTLKTVQNLTRSPERPDGLEVNHLVNVDFTGFARAVNEIDCVYVDVDRRYFHDNDATFGAGDYDEINIQPGYQALCGLTALDYVRYRHTDNDVVRAARQQDFLREARAKVPPEQLFLRRNRMIDIFKEHTTSDISGVEQLLDMLKLFIEARDAPVKEIHFEGTLGPSFVTATDAQIDKAVNQFLGIQDTPGARGDSAAPTEPVVPEDERKPEAAAPKAKKKKKPSIGSLSDASLAPTSYGKQLARGMLAQRRKLDLPVYYPTVLLAGSDYDQKPRIYKINGTGRGSPPDGQRLAYKWVFSTPNLGEYYGFMATKWEEPPILNSPSEEREIGDRTYKLYYDDEQLRTVAWQDDSGSFWVSNTLIQSLSVREMIEIARGMRELPQPGAK